MRIVATAVVMLVCASSPSSALTISYKQTVTLKVGEKTIVHGARGACGEPPPEWSDVAAHLPKVELGVFSDGGVGTRMSNQCKGETPARAVVFTAQKVGMVKVRLFGDLITITVKK